MRRNQILALLEHHRGQPLSGPRIARELHLSRSAVWKAVRVLQSEGHIIRALGRKGYVLEADSDGLSPEAIAAAYGKAGGRQAVAQLKGTLEIHPHLPSTNTYLKERAAAGTPPPTVVLAHRQTQGRGRMGRSFHSDDAGGVYLSLLLQNPDDTLDTDLVTIAAALAVSDTLDALYGITTGVKWVNDVYHGDRKVAGILTEGALEMESGRIPHLVLGVGINVSTTDFPEALRPIAASLWETTGKRLPRTQVAGTLLAKLEDILPRTRTDPRALLARYREKLLYLGEPIWVFQGNQRHEGVLRGVDEAGSLLLDQQGTLRTLRSGEVRIRKQEGGHPHDTTP